MPRGPGGGARALRMAAPSGSSARRLVQYVVLRGDLQQEPLSWPLGALVAQACHAALAVAHAHYGHADTGAYLAEGGSMRTVVLEVSGARWEPLAQGKGGGGHGTRSPWKPATGPALKPPAHRLQRKYVTRRSLFS
uniref:peptidyl-tRNA hydrolase n=1 Tax=Chelydra serpentina TaxID=8475 RepID=A0A8C3SE45_CHESE